MREKNPYASPAIIPTDDDATIAGDHWRQQPAFVPRQTSLKALGLVATIAGLNQVMYGIVYAGFGLTFRLGWAVADDDAKVTRIIVVGAVIVLVGAANCIGGIGIFQLRSWGRTIETVLAVLGMLVSVLVLASGLVGHAPDFILGLPVGVPHFVSCYILLSKPSADLCQSRSETSPMYAPASIVLVKAALLFVLWMFGTTCRMIALPGIWLPNLWTWLAP